jgi:hypothetical protein
MITIDAEPVAGTHAYAAIRRDALTVGTRVVVVNSGHLSGQTGVVIEMAEKLLNGHDVCVEMEPDERAHDERWPLCFYWHELAVRK